MLKVEKWLLNTSKKISGTDANTVQLEGVPGASATRERGEGFTNIAEESLTVLDSQTANLTAQKD